MNSIDREDVRKRIEALAGLSKDLENQAKLQSKAANVIAAEQYKRKVSELTEAQNKMMLELVSMHPDPAVLEKFRELQSSMESYQGKIRSTKLMTELRELEASLDSVVNQYVHHFQSAVAELMGAPPPAGPVFT